MVNSRKKKKHFKIKSKDIPHYIFPTVLWLIILVWCVTFLIFTVWGFLSAFKTADEFYFNPAGLPTSLEYLTFDNFIEVIKNLKYEYPDGSVAPFPQLLWNSFLLSFGSAFLASLTLTLTSYVYAKYSHISFTSICFVLFLWCNYVTLGGDLGTTLKFLKAWGLYNNVVGYWVWNMGGFGGGWLIYYAMWKGINMEYSDAAKIDGAGPWRILFQILFPMTKGLFWVQVLMKFQVLWGNYMVVVNYMPDFPTFAMALWKIRFSTGDALTGVGAKIAGFLIFSVPLGIVTYAMRNTIMNSMSVMGGIKG